MVRLAFNLHFFSFIFTLLSQEVSQINFDSSRGSGSEIVRTGLRLLFLKIYELGLDHFHFLLFALQLNALFFFLGWCQGFKIVHAVSVSSEYTLVVHDI
jgi:hypothetical protein